MSAKHGIIANWVYYMYGNVHKRTKCTKTKKERTKKAEMNEHLPQHNKYK